jgi:polyphosphate glucokinase
VTRENPTDHVLGIDIGGTGIKGGIVDLATGKLITERARLDTPKDATPDSVGRVVGELASKFEHSGTTGVTYPGVIENGVAMTAANLDKGWIGTSLVDTIGKHLPGDAVFVNDADAAGLAEVRYGAGSGHEGLVVLVTWGTGIGTALIYDGQLIPNSELGHIEVDGREAERQAAASVMKRKNLSWEEWAKRASKYLQTLERLVWPELFIFGGGISKKPDPWLHLIECRTPVTIATLLNNAGIVGAALVALESLTVGLPHHPSRDRFDAQ